MRLLKRSLLCLFVAFIGYAGVSAFFAWQLTGPVRRIVGEIPSEFPVTTQVVTFPASDGVRLSGWLVPCPNTTKAVLLLHGNGQTRRQMIARAKLFHDAGYAALLYDARGHGVSEGDRVSAGLLETSDLLGALEFLRTKGLHEFGLIGASQGGATILLAAEKLSPEVRWVIVEGTYPTIRDAIDRRFRQHVHLPLHPVGLLFISFAELRLGVEIDTVSPIDAIAALRRPVFVLGGADDPLTLAASTQALYESARQPKELWLVPGAAHVDLYGFAKEAYANRIEAFIKKASANPR